MQPNRYDRRSTARQIVRTIVSVCCVWMVAATALAGGGPENVLLVVNRDRPDSLTIANHYIQMRRIPAGNVLTLRWDPKKDETDINTFRTKILKPIRETIEKRRLSGQIDYVVYSSGFPWRITYAADVKKPLVIEPKYAYGSLNGLTYLNELVMAEDREAYKTNSNRYMRRPDPAKGTIPSLAFSGSYQFGPGGELVESGGRRYLLSIVLGVTIGRGNSVDEVLAYLRSSASADGTQPSGTIYFAKNDDIRSKTRHRAFPAAKEELLRAGVASEIVDGKLPMKRNDVQGVMTGIHTFTWESSGSTILPGAICENLTSFSGYMRASNYQTALSEFLRYGAAGSSGTVAEPFAIQAKFPHPMTQVHYARGCTLAEAFYQSVYGPYQLLIVGDPLCRPWANIPDVEVEGVEPGQTVEGILTLTPSAEFSFPSKVDRFELFVDGLRMVTSGPEEPLVYDTQKLADGYHELRVVAIQAGPIRSQGRKIVAITTANHGRKITASLMPMGRVRPGQAVTVSANSPGSTQIAVLHNSRLLGMISGESGQLRVDPSVLGDGPLPLRVVGIGPGGPADYAWAKPLTIQAGP